MELNVVDFELAKKLNGLGFPKDYDDAVYIVGECWEDDGNYGRKRHAGELVYYPTGLSVDDWISAPSLELVAKWLREKGIHICPTYHTWKDWRNPDGETEEYYYLEINGDEVLYRECPGYSYNVKYKTYEGALLDGIKRSIESWKTK